MSANIIAFLLGLFGVPIALLAVGHRLRRRAPRVRSAFMGAFIGHCVAGVLAVLLGMIPPEAWTPEETGRGFAGLWSLLVLPVVGAMGGSLWSKGRRVSLDIHGVREGGLGKPW
ncbi:MAG: hypothetical protein AABZ80_12765 [Gemmatimonadota bacterium]